MEIMTGIYLSGILMGNGQVQKILGPELNTKDGDSDMDVSPDGKYIFGYLNGNIYWMPVGDFLLQ